MEGQIPPLPPPLKAAASSEKRAKIVSGLEALVLTTDWWGCGGWNQEMWYEATAEEDVDANANAAANANANYHRKEEISRPTSQYVWSRLFWFWAFAMPLMCCLKLRKHYFGNKTIQKMPLFQIRVNSTAYFLDVEELSETCLQDLCRTVNEHPIDCIIGADGASARVDYYRYFAAAAAANSSSSSSSANLDNLEFPPSCRSVFKATIGESIMQEVRDAFNGSSFYFVNIQQNQRHHRHHHHEKNKDQTQVGEYRALFQLRPGCTLQLYNGFEDDVEGRSEEERRLREEMYHPNSINLISFDLKQDISEQEKTSESDTTTSEVYISQDGQIASTSNGRLRAKETKLKIQKKAPFDREENVLAPLFCRDRMSPDTRNVVYPMFQAVGRFLLRHSLHGYISIVLLICICSFLWDALVMSWKVLFTSWILQHIVRFLQRRRLRRLQAQGEVPVSTPRSITWRSTWRATMFVCYITQKTSPHQVFNTPTDIFISDSRLVVTSFLAVAAVGYYKNPTACLEWLFLMEPFVFLKPVSDFVWPILNKVDYLGVVCSSTVSFVGWFLPGDPWSKWISAYVIVRTHPEISSLLFRQEQPQQPQQQRRAEQMEDVEMSIPNLPKQNLLGPAEARSAVPNEKPCIETTAAPLENNEDHLKRE